MSIFEEYWKNIIKTGAEAGEPQATTPAVDEKTGSGYCELCDKPNCKSRTPEALAEKLSCEDCGAEMKDLDDCWECGGTGWITEEQKAAGADFTGHCDDCDGTGKNLKSKMGRAVCDHHGFYDCEPCDAIQSFILHNSDDENDDMLKAMRHHVKRHTHPFTGNYFDGKIDGKEQD